MISECQQLEKQTAEGGRLSGDDAKCAPIQQIRQKTSRKILLLSKNKQRLNTPHTSFYSVIACRVCNE